MIVDPSSQVLVANLGWVDHGSLWMLDAGMSAPRSVKLSEASHLRLHGGPQSERFVAEHHFADSHRIVVTVQTFERPTTPLVTVEVQGWRASVEGDPSAFEGLPTAFVGHLGPEAAGIPGYFLITMSRGGANVRRLDWFDDRFDQNYQSVMSVLQQPNGEYLFSVQRSSELVLCDAELEEVRRVPMADRYGNPVVIRHPATGDLWVTDYDTLVRLDPGTLGVVSTHLLQPEVSGARRFVGSPWAIPASGGVLVARPAQGDVIRMSPSGTELVGRWVTGRQPLASAMLGGRLVARDWKSGDLLVGQR